jgi:hypothetical protein
MKKRLWLAMLVIVASMILWLTPCRAQYTGFAQATMHNKTRYTLDFYVDGENCCRALSGGFCTTHVKPGVHTFYAQSADGRIKTQPHRINLDAGDSWDFPVEIRTRTLYD